MRKIYEFKLLVLLHFVEVAGNFSNRHKFVIQNEPANNYKGNGKNNNYKKRVQVNIFCVCIKVRTLFCAD